VHLTQRLEDIEKYSRKSNDIIYGLPKTDKQESEEQLTAAVQELELKLETNLEPYDFCAIHRLQPSKNGKRPPAVIVKLNNRSKKKTLVKKSRELRLKDVYVTNHLTKNMQDTKAVALNLRDEKLIKHVWDTDEGDVLIRITDQSPVIRVNSPEEVGMLRKEIEAKAASPHSSQTVINLGTSNSKTPNQSKKSKKLKEKNHQRKMTEYARNLRSTHQRGNNVNTRND
jgi:hypothetical protein